MATIKQQYADNIKVYWDGRTGSLIDQSGNGNNGSFAGTPDWRNSSKGKELAFNGGANTVEIPSFNFDYSALTIFTVFRFSKSQIGTTYGVVAAKDFTGSNGRLFSLNLDKATDKLLFLVFKSSSLFTTITTTEAIPRDTDAYIACVYTFVSDNNSILDIYVNGVKAATQTTDARGPLDPNTTSDVAIGGSKYASFENEFLGNIREFGMMDVALTSKEVSQLYEQSLQEGHVGTLPKRNFQLPESITGNETGLVGGWNMDIKGDKVIDVSSGGNDATSFGKVQDAEGVFGRAMDFDGATGYLKKSVSGFRSADNVGSIEVWFKLKSLGSNHSLFSCSDEGATNDFLQLVIPGTDDKLGVQVTSPTNNTVVSDTTLQTGVLYHGVVTSNGSAWKLYLNGVDDGATATFGSNTGDWFSELAGPDNIVIGALERTSVINFSDALIDSVKVYSTELTQAEVTAAYNKGAQKLIYRNDFSDEPVTVPASVANGDIGDFHISTGTWKITDDGTDKWLENVTAGIVYIESQKAFGTWQFDLYKGDGTTIPGILFIADVIGGTGATGQDAYNAAFSGTERVVMGESTNGSAANLMYSASSYIAIQTKYSLRVTRSKIGASTIYIKGGAYTTWTVVSVTGGIGSNPFTDTTTTTSKYFLTDLDAGDKITNIKFWEGVVSPTDLP